MRQVLRLLILRQENGSQDEVLRIRHETDVQEMLRSVPDGVEEENFRLIEGQRHGESAEKAECQSLQKTVRERRMTSSDGGK